ncbi:MAG: phosphate signaling complex protein PhoU [Anaerolineales bacterium]|nr:phosphate signaling complex protein PhoU [Anaerolineales bacterium]
MAAGEAGSSSRVVFDRDLNNLRADVLRLGDMVASARDRSLTALREHDVTLAEEIIEQDAEVNALRFQIEEACLSMIATQQPAARDLRAVVAAMSMASDMERMGDHAAGIAKVVLRIGEKGVGEFPRSLTQMAELVGEMHDRALEAYAQGDDDLAYKVASQDDLIDDYYHALFGELVEMMVQEPGATATGVYLMFVGHNLERIADRVTNLAERVIFMSSGRMEELNPEPGLTDTN